MEAITRKKEVDEMNGMKVLSKPFSQTVATLDGASWGLTGSQKPTVLGANTPAFVTWYQSTYFDLAGMSIDDKTLFFKAVQVQRAFTPEFTSGATADYLMEQVLMVTTPIEENDLLAAFLDPIGQLNFEQIVYCETRVYSKTLDEGALSFPMLLHNNVVSGARASATDRIYCYRTLSLNRASPASGVDSATVPGLMIVLGADAKEEPEFEYLMRLKRSYELQNEPDRD
jgi:hypothetical protein